MAIGRMPERRQRRKEKSELPTIIDWKQEIKDDALSVHNGKSLHFPKDGAVRGVCILIKHVISWSNVNYTERVISEYVKETEKH